MNLENLLLIIHATRIRATTWRCCDDPQGGNLREAMTFCDPSAPIVAANISHFFQKAIIIRDTVSNKVCAYWTMTWHSSRQLKSRWWVWTRSNFRPFRKINNSNCRLNIKKIDHSSLSHQAWCDNVPLITNFLLILLLIELLCQSHITGTLTILFLLWGLPPQLDPQQEFASQKQQDIKRAMPIIRNPRSVRKNLGYIMTTRWSNFLTLGNG